MSEYLDMSGVIRQRMHQAELERNVPTDTQHLSAGTTTKWLTPAPKLVQRVCGADIDWAARRGSRAAPTHVHTAPPARGHGVTVTLHSYVAAM